jgi:acetamidase/formamidase
VNTTPALLSGVVAALLEGVGVGLATRSLDAEIASHACYGPLVATHEIALEQRTVHGHFSRELESILTVDSGDTVSFPTLDCGWGLGPPPPEAGERWRLQPRDPERDQGHALVGPIEVRGARPGYVLEVRVEEVRSGAWGWTWAAGWNSALNDRLRLPDLDGHLLEWTLDPGARVARDQKGREVVLRPFLGVLGMPPAENGVHSTMPPRSTGGNIDCKELVEGSTLFLPIAVEGALFSAGDGHAAQGDGEVGQMAIECPLERVRLTLTVRDDVSLTTPAAKTLSAWLTFGFDEHLDEAMVQALNAMLDLMERELNVDRKEALALASVVVDLRVTQVVNGVAGVHARLALDVLDRLRDPRSSRAAD